MNAIKRIIIIGIAAALLGCGNTSNSEDTAAESSDAEKQSAETTQTDNTPSTVTKDNFMQFPETPESEFVGASYEDGYEVQGCTSTDPVIVVPKTIDGKTVVSIGGYALSNKPCEAIVLPDSITRIGEAAFGLNPNMKYIYLGNSLKSIGHLPFNQNTALKEINIPDGTTSLDSLAFGCSEVERIYIPSSVTKIENYIAFECSNATIYTPAGSYAEEIAKQAGLPVVNE